VLVDGADSEADHHLRTRRHHGTSKPIEPQTKRLSTLRGGSPRTLLWCTNGASTVKRPLGDPDDLTYFRLSVANWCELQCSTLYFVTIACRPGGRRVGRRAGPAQ
jgi:hypothetical protein